MKKLLISFSCAWLALAANAPSTVLAQSVEWTSVPLLLGMQGRLVASDGAPMTGVKTLSFNLYAAPTEGDGALEREPEARAHQRVLRGVPRGCHRARRELVQR